MEVRETQSKVRQTISITMLIWREVDHLKTSVTENNSNSGGRRTEVASKKIELSEGD